MDTHRYTDLVVAGAGPAGCAAALVGARKGLRILLVDSAAQVGGTVCAGFHALLCGLYTDSHPQNAGDTLNRGIQSEMAEALAEQDPAVSCPQQRGRTFVLPFDWRLFRAVIRDKLSKVPGITVLSKTSVTGVDQAGDRITALRLSNGGLVHCAAVIDSTGEANVAQYAGALMQNETGATPQTRQLAGYSIEVRGLAGDIAMLPVAVPYCLRQAVDDGTLPQSAQFTVFNLTRFGGTGVIKLAVPMDWCNETAKLQRHTKAVFKTLQERLPNEFGGTEIVQTSPGILPRIGPRLRGDRTLRGRDIVTAKKHPGEASVRNAWPMERWSRTEGPQYEYVPGGDWYEIPAACLTTSEVINLACAGRCISATSHAAASVRAGGTCLALGELAAAIVEEQLQTKTTQQM